jgi:peptidyl-prolyl cis-trans isomerase B (cyclophilin B)
VERRGDNRSALIFIGFIVVAAMIGLAVVLLTGEDEEGGGLPTGCETVAEPAAKNVKLTAPPLKAPAAGTTATVSTSCGDFVITLDTAKAPKTSASFAFQAEQGVYDKTAFTRIAPGFVIQGGDPTGTQSGNAGYTVTEAPPPDTSYSKGVVAMAKSGAEAPGTSGSQFFVVIGPGQGALPPDYALLGTVTGGLDVVDRIASIGTDVAAAGGTGDGPPKSPVEIKSIKINPPAQAAGAK